MTHRPSTRKGIRLPKVRCAVCGRDIAARTTTDLSGRVLKLARHLNWAAAPWDWCHGSDQAVPQVEREGTS